MRCLQAQREQRPGGFTLARHVPARVVPATCTPPVRLPLTFLSLSDSLLCSGIVLYVSQNNTDLGLHADFAGHTGSGAQTVYYGGSHLALPTLS